jgi:signal peptidase I
MGTRSRTPGNAFSRWRRRRRLAREAKQLVKEARRILRKHRRRIKEDLAAEVRGAMDALKDSLASGRVASIQDRADKLDRLLDRYLSFARKSAFREYAESIGLAVLIALLLRAFVVEAFKIPSGSMIPTLDVGDHIFVNKFIYGLRVPFANTKFISVRSPRRGEIIVFIFPGRECKVDDECRGAERCVEGRCHGDSKDFIKRVIAIGGDRVELRQNQPIINGKPIRREQLPGPCTYSDAEEGFEHRPAKVCEVYEEELDGIRYHVIQDPYLSPSDMEPVAVPPGNVFVMGDNRDNSHDSRYWGTVPDREIKGKAMIIWWSSGDPDGVRWNRFFSLVHALPDSKP